MTALRQLNQLRTFAHGFDHLRAGDELDVPLSPLPAVQWEGGQEPPTTDEQGNSQQQKLAGLASQAGAFMKNSPNVDAASAMARGMMTSEISGGLQQWLSQFGSARVQLETNKNFSLKNSQFDLLLPLYEKQHLLVFTQGSLHRTDERTQGNLGFGLRRFDEGWMLGGNTFWDYDLSRDHARMGMGLEYWRDFLKLATNSYLRLTSWKNTKEDSAWEERPARGWDIRAEAWLPALPQLGGKLMYEQYYGNDVGLFGRNNRQRNPHAITAGISYTPFPLLTLSSEQRHGKSGENDSRFGIQMNYQLGVPWQHQITADNVGAMRSLAGSRYDRVERNNNIILEYRKKENIRLQTADLVTGYAGEQKSLNVSVNSKYGLARIDWSAPALIAAGGKVVQESATAYSVVLPDYQSQAAAVNSYTVSGVAVDQKGSVSSPAITEVKVSRSAINIDKSALSPPIITLPADGKSQQLLVLNVNDREGNPVDISEQEISVLIETKLRSTSATVSGFSRRAVGEYGAMLTAGTRTESFNVTPSALDTRLSSASVTLIADNTTAFIDRIESVVNNAPADGKSQNTVKVAVSDALGNRVPAQTIGLKASNQSSVIEQAITDSHGEVTVPVTSLRAGDSTVTASIDGKGDKEAKVTFTPDNSSATIGGQIQVTPTSAVVGETVTYTAMLVDGQGNALSAGYAVNWQANEGSELSAQTSTTDDSGSVRVELTRYLAGTAKVSMILPSGITSAADAVFSADKPDEQHSVLTLVPETIVAGTQTATLTLVLRDKNDNLISSQSVSGTSDNSAVTVSRSSEDKPGYYTLRVAGEKASEATLSVTVNDIALSMTKKITVTGDTTSGHIASVVPDKTSFTAGDVNGVTYRAVVADRYGNKLPQVMVGWQMDGESQSFEPNSRTNEEGVATVTVKSQKAGKLMMTARLDESNHIQADTVTVNAGPLDTAKSSFDTDKTEIAADGKARATLTVMLQDGYNNALSGKNVSIKATPSQGLIVSPVTDKNDGSYQATMTATSAGQIQLTASVAGERIDSSVSITVAATTPDLRFATAQQTVTYTRRFTESQSVSGAPDNVLQSWSSSVPDVATVNITSGKVTLLKAGVTTITVKTAGNDQYHPAQASYELTVEKADPQLNAGDGSPIYARWGDGITQSITATFGNADVGNKLWVQYLSQNTGIVTVTARGVLKAVKPGTTSVQVSTPETAQFKAATSKVNYILSKNTLNIRFDKVQFKTTDEKEFIVLQPVYKIPDDADTHWTSSDSKVVKLSDSGELLAPVSKGNTRLTLSVKANDYYNLSTGHYDVFIYSKPDISLEKVTWRNKGTLQTSGDWTPVFTYDDMILSWRVSATDEYSRPERVTVYLKDKNGSVLGSFTYVKPSGLKETRFSPQTAFWGKVVKVEVVAQGAENLSNSKNSTDIHVKNLEPKEIWTSFFIASQLETWVGLEQDTSCQETLFGKYHTNYVISKPEKISFAGHNLLSPMSIKAIVKSKNNTQTPTLSALSGTHNDITSDKTISFGKVPVTPGCWVNHDGNYKMGAEIDYAGKTYIYWSNELHKWKGNGEGMYKTYHNSVY